MTNRSYLEQHEKSVTKPERDAMPDVIYAWLNEGTFWSIDPDNGVSKRTKYVRDDIAPEQSARIERVEAALRDMIEYGCQSTEHSKNSEFDKRVYAARAEARAALEE